MIKDENLIRKNRREDYYLEHKRVLDGIGALSSDFTIKTPFYSNLSNLPGKNVQLFDGELRKNRDLYIELVEKVKDHEDNVVDLVPYDANRPLFVYRANPHYASEYPVKKGGYEGNYWESYLVNLSELKVVWKNQEMTFAEYEKKKDEEPVATPKEQMKVINQFPNFEEEFIPKPNNGDSDNSSDLASIILLDIAENIQRLALALKKK